jgi:hypothetical protein
MNPSEPRFSFSVALQTVAHCFQPERQADPSENRRQTVHAVCVTTPNKQRFPVLRNRGEGATVTMVSSFYRRRQDVPIDHSSQRHTSQRQTGRHTKLNSVLGNAVGSPHNTSAESRTCTALLLTEKMTSSSLRTMENGRTGEGTAIAIPQRIKPATVVGSIPSNFCRTTSRWCGDTSNMQLFGRIVWECVVPCSFIGAVAQEFLYLCVLCSLRL